MFKQLEVLIKVRMLFRGTHKVLKGLLRQRKLTRIFNAKAKVDFSQMMIPEAPKSERVKLVHRMQATQPALKGVLVSLQDLTPAVGRATDGSLSLQQLLQVKLADPLAQSVRNRL